MTHAEIVKKVTWKDLKDLSVREMLIENNLTLPGCSLPGYWHIPVITYWLCPVPHFSF